MKYGLIRRMTEVRANRCSIMNFVVFCFGCLALNSLHGICIFSTFVVYFATISISRSMYRRMVGILANY